MAIAIIGAFTTIVGAFLSYFAGRDGILIPLRATQTAEAKQLLNSPILLQPDNIVEPNISINTIQRDREVLIDVPYQVFIKGTATIPEDWFVYLIVYDGVAEYVQPEVLRTEENGFEGYCYLGEETDSKSINKRYTVFAVVTDQAHQRHTKLNPDSVKARSNSIELYRTQ